MSRVRFQSAHKNNNGVRWASAQDSILGHGYCRLKPSCCFLISAAVILEAASCQLHTHRYCGPQEVAKKKILLTFHQPQGTLIARTRCRASSSARFSLAFWSAARLARSCICAKAEPSWKEAAVYAALEQQVGTGPLLHVCETESNHKPTPKTRKHSHTNKVSVDMTPLSSLCSRSHSFTSSVTAKSPGEPTSSLAYKRAAKLRHRHHDIGTHCVFVTTALLATAKSSSASCEDRPFRTRISICQGKPMQLKIQR